MAPNATKENEEVLERRERQERINFIICFFDLMSVFNYFLIFFWGAVKSRYGKTGKSVKLVYMM